MYTKCYKTLLKEVLKDLKKWKDSLCSWVRRQNCHHVNTTQSSLHVQGRLQSRSSVFSKEMEKLTLKFIWSWKEP